MLQQRISLTQPFRRTPLCMETEDLQLERLENEQEREEMKYGLKCARDFVRLLAGKSTGIVPKNWMKLQGRTPAWHLTMAEDYFRIKGVSPELIPALVDMVVDWREEE
jgi:hypothetical protein